MKFKHFKGVEELRTINIQITGFKMTSNHICHSSPMFNRLLEELMSNDKTCFCL